MRIAACLLALTCLAPLALPLACGGGTPSPKGEDEAVSSDDKSSDDKAKSDDKSDKAAPEGSGAAAGADAPPADSSASAASAPAAAGDSSGDIKTPKADDPWMAAHTVPDGDVNKALKGKKKSFQGCYTKGKKKDPSTTGEVRVKFIISNDGKVKEWKDDSSSMSNEDVIKCVGEAIKKAKFPKQKSPGDAVGSFSINFNP